MFIRSRGRLNSAALRNVWVLSNWEGVIWTADSSLRLHFLFPWSSNLVINERKARGHAR